VQLCPVALRNGLAEAVLRGGDVGPGSESGVAQQGGRGGFNTPRTGALAHWVGTGLAEPCYRYCYHRVRILTVGVQRVLNTV